MLHPNKVNSLLRLWLTLVKYLNCDRVDIKCTARPSVLVAISSLTDDDVVLDTGARVSVFKNSRNVVDIRDEYASIEFIV